MESQPTIHVLSKKGPHSKWFDSRASMLTRDLYASELGGLPVTKRVVRTMNIRDVLWMEQDGIPIATAMLMHFSDNKSYRVCGIAIDPKHRRKGYGTAMMRKIETLLPHQARLCLGVDKDKEETGWLVDWYMTLGFQGFKETHDEFLLAKSVMKSSAF